MNETLITYGVYLHAALGGLALLSGGVALLVKKGGPVHRKAGKIFTIVMLLSVLIGGIVALLPGHRNSLLFGLAVLSAYLILSAYRILRFRPDNKGPKDYLLGYGLIVAACYMLLRPILSGFYPSIIALIFGILSIVFGVRHVLLLRKAEHMVKNRMPIHIGNMTGGYISATTAFLVVQNWFPFYISWFAPSVIGTAFIIYSIRKTNKK